MKNMAHEHWLHKKRWIAASMLAIFFFISAKNNSFYVTDDGNQPVILKLPQGFPYPNVPDDNWPTENKIALGKKLFFDPVLSKDSSISCSSCHEPANYFSDGLVKSKGVGGSTAFRNTPSILNVAYAPYLLWDGGVPTLEQQVLSPISNPLEMNFDVNEIVERLNDNPVYVAAFKQAFNDLPSVYTFTRAIASFERTLYSGNSKYDRYLYERDSAALTASEKNGMDIFFSEKGDCFHCHNGFAFTDFSFKNNGLYKVYTDSGRERITQNPRDYGLFKVPSLRNCEHTAPYMHDGSIATLEEVVEHYNKGGENNPNKNGLVRPLNLTEQEKTDLVNFLKALSSQ